MSLHERIQAFKQLGLFLRKYLNRQPVFAGNPGGGNDFKFETEKNYNWLELDEVIRHAEQSNPWFTPENIRYALAEMARILEEENLIRWLANYPDKSLNPLKPKTIGSILAGNIPLAGFHDFLSVLISGNQFNGKPSAKDDKLLPFLARMLINCNPSFEDLIGFDEKPLSQADAVIATGSNNTSRYFEYYFGKFPHIFRRNRNGIAVLTGHETNTELKALADDIFIYFGLGCRSVSKLFVPANYDFKKFFDMIEIFSHLLNHNKYYNNYSYQKAIYLLNNIEHLDNGFTLLKHDNSYISPIGVIFYEYYHDSSVVIERISADKDQIQCCVGPKLPGIQTIPFGKAQHPELWDFADDVDTLLFLINLDKN